MSPGGERPAFCLHVTLFTAGCFTAWDCTRPRVVGRGRGGLTMTSFPRLRGKRRGNDWGFVVAHVGGNDWRIRCRTHRGGAQLPMFGRHPCSGDNVEAEMRRLSSPWWHWCCPHDDWPCGRGARGWSELGPELISFSLRLLRNSSCISSMATELSSREL